MADSDTQNSTTPKNLLLDNRGKNFSIIFYVLLAVYPGMTLANNQLDAQFFTYIYFYSLHASGSHAPIIRRIIVSMRQPALCHSV